jgi:putative tributyrin esterase
MRLNSILRSIIFIFAGLLIFLSACNHPASVPFVDHPQIAAGVRIQDVSFNSRAMNREMRYRVFLPATIKTNTKLPVVYLLHGCGGDMREWSNYSQISNYATRGLILVIPEGQCSYWVNEVGSPADRYEDYVTQDLIADVESHFPVKPGRESRAIVGVSMGGFGAVDYAFVHPELYCFAGGLSPAVDVPSRKFRLQHYDQWMRFRHIFGSTGSAERNARDPFKLVEKVDPQKTPYIYITAGEQESMLESIKRFAGRLKARGFTYEFHSKPGWHDWQEWNLQLDGCMNELLKRIE